MQVDARPDKRLIACNESRSRCARKRNFPNQSPLIYPAIYSRLSVRDDVHARLIMLKDNNEGSREISGKIPTLTDNLFNLSIMESISNDDGVRNHKCKSRVRFKLRNFDLTVRRCSMATEIYDDITNAINMSVNV